MLLCTDHARAARGKESSGMAWEIDATHSHARFSIRQMGASAIQGQFKAMSGYVYVDEINPSHSWVDVAVDATSIDTGDAQRDSRLRSTDVLDVAAYATITFKSVRVEHIVSQDYKVSGGGDEKMRPPSRLGQCSGAWRGPCACSAGGAVRGRRALAAHKEGASRTRRRRRWMPSIQAHPTRIQGSPTTLWCGQCGGAAWRYAW